MGASEGPGSPCRGTPGTSEASPPVQERLCLGDVVEGSVLLRLRGSGPALGCVNASCAAGRGLGRAVPGGRLGTGRPALEHGAEPAAASQQDAHGGRR